MKKLLFIFLLQISFSNSKDKISIEKCQRNKNEISKKITPGKEIEYYRLEISHAVKLLKEEKLIIDLELNKNRIEILSIGFPEIIRYNSFSDYIETSSNRILYINKGKKVSDFSIGYFQMKPSFVEDLENYVTLNESLKENSSILIKKKTDKEIRTERIKRLENFQWQLRYLKVFWDVAEHKYKHIDFKTKTEKIRFYATAYNYGFTKPEKEIIHYQTVKIFPYGKLNTEKFAFSDFSIDFIKTYSNSFNY